MCGIFAYSGSRDVKNILIKGLKKLEYRGYDSAGVAFFKDNQIQCFKSAGDLSHLEKLVRSKKSNGCLGMGHTRWATHGTPTKQNSHPHSAGSIYVIHNGVIENEQDIKERWNVTNSQSETDSESIAHLIFQHYKEESHFLKSVFRSIKHLRGSYAVVVLCEDFPDEMIGFTNGPPLLLCQGKQDLFISSDMQSSSEYAKKVIPLEVGELVHIKKQDFQIFNQEEKKIQKTFIPFDKQKNISDKKGFPHFMLKEIFEQPEVVFRLLQTHINKKEDTFDLKLSKGSMSSFQNLMQKAPSLLIVACGSSYYVALFAQYLIEEIAQVKVFVERASEFIYRPFLFSPETPVFFISQSGETADTLMALKLVQKKHLQTVSLCNVQGSSLERYANYGLDMQAGVEIGVASTKSFTASLLLIYFLACFLNKESQLSQTKSLKSVLALPSYIEQVLSQNESFKEQSKKLRSFSGFLFLGRNRYYPMALEGALKLKEISYLTAEAYPSGEMKHGPLALINPERAVVALMPPQGLLYDKTLINLKEARARGAYSLVIGGGKDMQPCYDERISLPSKDLFLHTLLTVIPLQMLAYFMACDLGYNPDRPRHLAKSVTVE